MRTLHRLKHDESGMSYVFIGCGFMAFLSASMLAIDVGMLMTSRNQAQNSADAGALAGATALVFNSYTDRTPGGPAVTNAIQAARFNQVAGAVVSVTAPDVEFLNDPTGEPNRVRVTVRRTAGRGNPVSTLIARYFGVLTADIGAVATAEASPANAMTCVLPLTIPDRWMESSTGRLADPENGDQFDIVDKHGAPVPSPDVYVGPENASGYTGYDAVRDKGKSLILKASVATRMEPSFYQAWAISEGVGADYYRENIGGCNTYVMGFGQVFTPEPGNMVGPTGQGIADLIAKDPNAYWSDSENRVISSMKPSPRVRAIPLFDPVFYDEGKRNSRNATLKFVNYLGFFIEGMQGGNVIGRITPIGGMRVAGMGPAPEAAFPQSIRLVQ
jgi:Flp pilus assembly protein TadG